MPSKKPIIHFNTEQWIIDKMKYIAAENSRSLAKEMEYLCKQSIKKYEAEHGIIEVEPIITNKEKIDTITNYMPGISLPLKKKIEIPLESEEE